MLRTRPFLRTLFVPTNPDSVLHTSQCVGVVDSEH